MLARRPSLQHAYEFISRHDDALALPAGEDEREHALQVARDTGDYAPLLVDGKRPERFVLRPVDAIVARRLIDDHTAGRLGMNELLAWAFRAALDSVIGEFVVKHEEHERYGKVTTRAAIDAFHDAVINEIGLHVWLRAVAMPPKS